MSKGWHMVRQENCLTHTRVLPVRFDVQALSTFPMLNSARLARQIRQDMWRRLQSLRGFSPVVEVRKDASGLTVRAGGRVEGSIPTGTQAKIEALLNDPDLRRRWARCARVQK